MDDLGIMALAGLFVLAVALACISLVDSAQSIIEDNRQNEKLRKEGRK